MAAAAKVASSSSLSTLKNDARRQHVDPMLQVAQAPPCASSATATSSASHIRAASSNRSRPTHVVCCHVAPLRSHVARSRTPNSVVRRSASYKRTTSAHSEGEERRMSGRSGERGGPAAIKTPKLCTQGGSAAIKRPKLREGEGGGPAAIKTRNHSERERPVAMETLKLSGPQRSAQIPSNRGLLAAIAGAVWEQRVLGGVDMVGSAMREAARKVRVSFLDLRSPGFPPGPEADVALSMASDPLTCINELAADFGGAVGIKMAGEWVVLISDPKLAREVFVMQSDIFKKTGTAFFPGSTLVGNGIIVSDGDIWERQRRLSTPVFRKAAVNSYAEAMVEVTRLLLDERWGAGGIRDVYDDFNDLTMQIVATSLFGGRAMGGQASVASDVVPAITATFKHFVARGTSIFVVPEWFPTPENIQYNAAVAKLDKIVYRLITERRLELTNMTPGSPPRRDLLSKLIKASDEDGYRMDDRTLRDELMTFLIAGQETTAVLISWIAATLCVEPHTQERLAQEVRQVLGSRSPTHADLKKLPFLEAVVYETMRLLPPSYIVGRCANRTTTLGDQWTIPKGTTILVSPYVMHRDPRYWPRAEKFDPDRWMPGGDATSPAENHAYTPFGGGPRMCLGMGFAMMEVSLVVASVLQRYDLSLPDGGVAPTPCAMLTLRPGSHVHLRVTPHSS